VLDASSGFLQVSAKEIANLDEVQLRELVFRFCRFETALSKGDTARVLFPSEVKAADDGCDGSTPGNDGSSRWLPAGATCWQLKAGQAGEPGRLRGEITKAIPREYLLRGDHYALVASGCQGGERQIRKRLAVLSREANRAKLPTDKIGVLGAEALAAWCNERPTIGRWLLQRGGMTSVDEWGSDPLHGIPYRDSPSRKGQLQGLVDYLDPVKGPTSHVHLHGHPGVGKSRLALEACRAAPWRDAVAYFPEPGPDARILIEQLRTETASRAVVVVDECRAEHVKALSASVRLAGGRVRLLTVGADDRDVLDLGRTLAVAPYGRGEIEAILRGWFPNMNRERVEFAAKLADGYVKYARIIGEALDANPDLRIADLVGRSQLSRLLGELLGTLNRQHLYVLAVCQSLGWSGDLEDEGRAVAKHFGLDWAAVKATALQAKRTHGILRSSDQLCYIAPLPLALLLATEAWEVYGEQLRTLPEVLPRESAVAAYHERLGQLGGSPYATEFFRTELERYEKLNDFGSRRAARLWAALSAGEPRGAVSRLRAALEKAKPEERLEFEGEPRREVMWALPRLAWDAETFEDTMFALAELAVAENERWANNATGEFISHFQVHLGGTVVPYEERLSVLDALLNRRQPQYQGLVLSALAKAMDAHASRSGGGERHPAKAAGPEWRPSNQEAHAARLQALSRLAALIPELADSLQGPLLEEMKGFFWPLSRFGYAQQLGDLVARSVQRFPGLREPLRSEAASHIALSKRAGAGQEVPAALVEIHEALVDRSVEGQLRQHVGPHEWDQEGEGQEGRQPLVDAFLSSPELLDEHMEWLTSGEANAAFQFGWALADKDAQTALLRSILRRERGLDLRLHAGYLLGTARRLGEAWLDDLLEQVGEEKPSDSNLIVEVAARGVPTERRASLVSKMLEAGAISPDVAAPFAHSLWIENLSLAAFRRLLFAIIATSAGRRLGVKMLAFRLKAKPEEREALGDAAVVLAGDPAAVVHHTHEEWLWGQIASAVADRAGSAIVRALCDLQLTDDFFLQHHDAAEDAFLKCAELQPEQAWGIVAEYLEGPERPRFVVGFPKAFVTRIPVELILAWIAEDAPQRAAVVAHIVSPDFSSDEALDSRLIEKYGHHPAVGGGFFGGLIGGTSMGPISMKWGGLAGRMDQVSRRTRLPRLRKWARTVAGDLREMERRAAAAEEDDAIRRR
jgi:hypothetical protein